MRLWRWFKPSLMYAVHDMQCMAGGAVCAISMQ